MQEFDKLANDVVVIAATNRLDILDKAFVSRCSQKYEMPPFTVEESKQMVNKFLNDIEISIPDIEIDQIVQKIVTNEQLWQMLFGLLQTGWRWRMKIVSISDYAIHHRIGRSEPTGTTYITRFGNTRQKKCVQGILQDQHRRIYSGEVVGSYFADNTDTYGK